MNYQLKRIGVWSAVKISFLINGLLGLILGFFAGFILFFFRALLMNFAEFQGGMDINPSMMGGAFAIIILPLMYAFFLAVVNGIIITGVSVLLYNLFSNLTGGIEIELNSIALAQAAAPPMQRQTPPPIQPAENTIPPDKTDEPKNPVDGDDKREEPPLTSEGGVDV